MKNNIPGKNYMEKYALEGLCITVQIVTVFTHIVVLHVEK